MRRSATTGREATSERLVIRPPGFVGRARELSALADAFAAGPVVVVVEGEAGIGKSRLVREFLAAGQVPALVAACPPFRQPHTLGPVADSIRLAAAGRVAELGLSPLAGALRPLFPDWAAELPPALEPAVDAGAARHRVFTALAELLGALGVSVLVVEDAHWADEATLEFLLFVVSRQPRQVSLLITCRPEEVADGSLLRRLSRQAAGAAGLRCTLAPLDVSQTTSLVSSMLSGAPVSAEFAEFVHERTDGLPLAVEESVRLMGDRADLTLRRGEWARRHLADIEVPPTVRDAVLERVARLGGEAVAVLRAAAVLGEPAAEPVVLAVAGLEGEAAGTGLGEACRCGLVNEVFLYGPGLAFRHGLAARVVYEAIPGLLRRDMHQRAGQALEQSGTAAPARLARHFREAGELAAWSRYGEQAADLALAAGDHNAAAVLLHDLIANARLPEGAIAQLARKIPIMAFTGYAPVEDIARSLRSILASDTLTPDQRAEARSRLGDILFDSGEYEAAVVELKEAIAGLAHRPVATAFAMAWLGLPCHGRWPAGEHREWLDRAAEIMAGHPIGAVERLKLLGYRATGLLMMGDESGWAAAAELPEDADSPHLALPLAASYLNCGDIATSWGRHADARQLLARSLRLADHYFYPRVRDGALVALAHLDWFAGSWDGLAARVTVLAALSDAEPMVRLEAALIQGLLDAATGATQSADSRLRQVLEEELRRGMVNTPLEPGAALARLRLARGEIGDALALTGGPMKVISAKGIWMWATEVVPVRVQALLAADMNTEAADLVNAFANGLGGSSAAAPQAALVACRALLAQSRGEHARAAATFGQAGAAWRALPRPYDALLAQERQGDCLLTAGEREMGLAVLATAQRGLETLGARVDADRVAGTLRQLGVATPRAWRGGRRGYGGQLSPREKEVVCLVTAGRTNREIAAALSRSPATVAMQIQSAMRKLGVSSRTALAVRVLRGDDAADPQASAADQAHDGGAPAH